MGTDPPAGLALVLDFENTLDLDTGADQLATPGGLADWLAGRALLAAGGPLPGPDELATVREFREAVRALLLANNGEPLDQAAPATLNRIAARARLQVGFPVGLLRPLQEPLGRVVHHGRVRQPGQGPRLPGQGTWRRRAGPGTLTTWNHARSPGPGGSRRSARSA